MSIKSAALSLQPYGNLIAAVLALVGSGSYVGYKLGERSMDDELISQKLADQARIIDMKMQIDSNKKEIAKNPIKYFHQKDDSVAPKGGGRGNGK